MMERRDVYKREKLQYWINRVRMDSMLSEADKQDILRFIDFIQREERSSLRIIRCITAVILAKKVIKKQFRECTKEDIRHFINYQALLTTIHKFHYESA